MYRQTPHPPLSAKQCVWLLDEIIAPDLLKQTTSTWISHNLTQVQPFLEKQGYRLQSVRAVIVGPSQQIVGHADRLPEGTIRLHIPLLTNDQSWVLHDGVWQRLTLGCTYAMDPTKWHGAVNWGTEPRIHLLVE